MGLFDQFPYTNFHELNLMWILEALKEIQTTTEQFIAINSLKYADPIQWNITTQYEKNTIVIDPQSGTAYISVQAVPAGVALTNTDYWTVVFDLEQFVTKANNNFTLRVEEQTTTTATFPTNKGQWVIWGGVLYEALSNIIAGDQYIENSNIKRITVEDITGDLIDLDTTDTSNLVSAINEILANLQTEISTRSTQVNNLQTSINNEVTNRQNADALLQTNIDNVASGLAQEISTRSTQVNNLQTSINNEVTEREAQGTRLQASIDYVNNRVNQVKNKKVVIIADSYGMVHDTTFLSILKSYAPNIYDGVGVSSIGFLPVNPYTYTDQFDTFIANYTQQQKDDVTDVVLCGGWNDAREIYQGGKTGAQLNAAILAASGHIRSICTNAVVHPCFMAWHSARSTQNQVTLAALQTVMKEYSGAIAYGIYGLTDCKYVMRDVTNMDSSFFHPNDTTGAMNLAIALHENLFSGSTHYNNSYNYSYAYFTSHHFNAQSFVMRISLDDNITKIQSGPLLLDAGSVSGGIVAVCAPEHMMVTFPSPSGGLGAGYYLFTVLYVKGTINGVAYNNYVPTGLYIYGNGNLLLLAPDGNLVTSIGSNTYIIFDITIDNQNIQ